MKNTLLRRLVEVKAIYREPVILRSGVKSDFYLDVKLGLGYPDISVMICEGLWEKIDKRTICVAAMGNGGIPLASDLKMRYNLKMTMVRDKLKDHGKGGWIDGYVPKKGDVVSIVDDVFTTGGSMREVIGKIEPTGAEIVGCAVVVKRGDGDIGYPWDYIITSDEIMAEG